MGMLRAQHVEIEKKDKMLESKNNELAVLRVGQRVAVCCDVLQRVAVCHNVLQCVAVCCRDKMMQSTNDG